MHSSMKSGLNFPYGDNEDHLRKPDTKFWHNTVKLYTKQLQSVRTTEYIHWDIVMGLTVSNSFFKKNFSKYFKMYEYITCDVHNLKLHIENTFKQTAMYIF